MLIDRKVSIHYGSCNLLAAARSQSWSNCDRCNGFGSLARARPHREDTQESGSLRELAQGHPLAPHKSCNFSSCLLWRKCRSLSSGPSRDEFEKCRIWRCLNAVITGVHESCLLWPVCRGFSSGPPHDVSCYLLAAVVWEMSDMAMFNCCYIVCCDTWTLLGSLARARPHREDTREVSCYAFVVFDFCFLDMIDLSWTRKTFLCICVGRPLSARSRFFCLPATCWMCCGVWPRDLWYL